MNSSNITNSLSRFYVAEKTGKKLIILNSSNCSFALLNTLWKDGFIYGYEQVKFGKINVFLKHYHSGGFSNIIFLKKQKVSLKEIKSLLYLNKNYYYLILTSRGVLSGNQCVIKNLGGSLIARL